MASNEWISSCSSCGADCARFSAGDCGNEARACVGQPETEWLEHVTREKEAGESKSSDNVVEGSIICGQPAEKCRQGQQLVLPRLARLPRHRTCRFRRNIDKIDFIAAGNTACEIEAKTELGQKLQLEPHQACSRAARIEENIEQVCEGGMNLRM